MKVLVDCNALVIATKNSVLLKTNLKEESEVGGVRFRGRRYYEKSSGKE